MKQCAYCGRENSDDALQCRECATEFKPAGGPPPLNAAASSAKTERPESELPPLSEADRQKDLVTLVRCRTLIAADMIVARLRAEGIEAFLPDEGLMQAIGWNFNTYGYVRVQVAPRDYDAARELLGDLG